MESRMNSVGRCPGWRGIAIRGQKGSVGEHLLEVGLSRGARFGGVRTAVNVLDHDVYDNVEPNNINFRYLRLNTGRHEIEVYGNLMLAITVRE